MFSTDPSVYDRSLESFIGLSAATHELTQEELEKRMNKHYTVQFQDLTCVNLKDYRLCVVVSVYVLYYPYICDTLISCCSLIYMYIC